MQKVSYKTEDIQTESGTKITETVSLELLRGERKPFGLNPPGKAHSQFINLTRTEGITTFSITEENEHAPYPPIVTRFETTIEDEKLKQAVVYLGEMFLTGCKLVLMKVVNEDSEENS